MKRIRNCARWLLKNELATLNSRLEELEQRTAVTAICPGDPNDNNNIFLEIRAGTGGDEAAIFAGDLFRMYQKYTEGREPGPWKCSARASGEHGGFKEIIVRVVGQGAFSRFKFESGTHRVQRVPETESQGRIHTSACTVAILPEVENVEEIDHQSGRSAHLTHSALQVRADSTSTRPIRQFASHIYPAASWSNARMKGHSTRTGHGPCPYCRHACSNRSRADRQSEVAESRRLQVGSGDRSQRIRTYNFPQGRITDHRVNLTLYKLDEVLGWDLDMIIDPLLQEHQADLLVEMGA